MDQARFDRRFQRRFRKILRTSFGPLLDVPSEEALLRQLGDEGQVDDFFDDLEFEFSGDLEEEARADILTVAQAIEWSRKAAIEEAAGEGDEDEDDEDEEQEGDAPVVRSVFYWYSQLSPTQKTLFSVARWFGSAFIPLGIQLSVHYQGGAGAALTAYGILILFKVEDFLSKIFNFLEKRNSRVLQLGYPTIAWIVIALCYVMGGVYYAASKIWWPSR